MLRADGPIEKTLARVMMLLETLGKETLSPEATDQVRQVKARVASIGWLMVEARVRENRLSGRAEYKYPENE